MYDSFYGGTMHLIRPVHPAGVLFTDIVPWNFLQTRWGKDRIDITTNGTYPWSFVTQILRNGQLSYGDERKTFEVMTST
jgi:hypothetical protein